MGFHITKCQLRSLVDSRMVACEDKICKQFYPFYFADWHSDHALTIVMTTMSAMHQQDENLLAVLDLVLLGPIVPQVRT